MNKKFKIKDLPLVDRPREKMKAKGPQNLPVLVIVKLG